MPAQSDKTAAAVIIEPPAVARRVESSVSESMLQSMKDTIAPGVWVTDGETYPTDGKIPNRKAVNAAAKHKRPLARLMNLDPSRIKARVWQVDPDNDKSDYVFALTLKASDSDNDNDTDVTADADADTES